MFNISILNEFENLNPYKKAVLIQALHYGEFGMFKLDEECIAFLSFSLNIEYELLKKYLSHKNIDDISSLENKYSVNIDSTFFEIMIRIYYMRKSLDEVNIDDNKELLNENINLIFWILHHLQMININFSTSECMRHNTFSNQYAIYSGEDFYPRNLYDVLLMFLNYEEYYDRKKSMLPIIYQLITYELYTRINNLHLISIVQMVKTSIFFKKHTHNIADELYENLLFVLKNAKVISIQINILYQNLETDFDERIKKKDNTTRLQIMYSYDNYDTYSLRLDLAHKNVGWMHYNNKSPGGTKSYLFTQQERDSAIERFPSLENCFIQYDKKWALKEKTNCNLTKTGIDAYDTIKDEKSHERVFNGDYSEQHIMEFMELVGNMFPTYYKVPIDKEELHSKYCFNFSKIIEGLNYYYLLSYTSDIDSQVKVREFILSRAVNYGLINENEKKEYDSTEGMYLISELAKARINIKYLY